MRLFPLAAATAAALLVAACSSTKEPPRPDPAEAELKQASAEARACYDQVSGEKQFAGVAAKFTGISGGEPKPAQLRDRAKPSVAEARLLAQYQAKIGPCREMLYKGASSRPRFVAALKSYHARNDAVFKALGDRRISWGEGNTLMKKNGAEFATVQKGLLADRAGEGRDVPQGEIDCEVAEGNIIRCSTKP